MHTNVLTHHKLLGMVMIHDVKVGLCKTIQGALIAATADSRKVQVDFDNVTIA